MLLLLFLVESKNLPSLVFLACLSVITIIISSTEAVTYVNFMSTWATLLSGGLTSCANPSNVSALDCLGGLASADAYLRNHSLTTGEPVFLSYAMDRNTPFVQMHPLDWGVNRLALQTIFNYTSYRGTHAVLTSTRNMTYMQDPTLPFTISNALVPPSNSWIDVVKTVFFDSATKIAFISIQSGVQPNSFDSFSSVAGALEIVARTSGGPWYPVVYFDDPAIDFPSFVSFVSDLTKVKVRAAAIVTEQGPSLFYQANGTWIAGISFLDTIINHVRFTVSATVPGQFDTAERFVVDLTKIPVAIKDSYYASKQVQLKAEAVKASANNPTVGQSTAMPLTRTGSIRMCMAGECPLGDLWTEAQRWKGDADIAFEPSGGVRGPGWPAGPVKISDLWAALPFVNQFCYGKISGINLYKALNHSVALATFTSTLTNTGDRLLQCSGCRITYNTLLDPANRLVSVEVKNRVTGQFEPLQRLKIYKFATNSFICRDFLPYPTFFTSADIEGEVAGKITDDIIQSVVADYLGSLSAPYDTSLKGSMINDTSAVAMQSFVQTLATCPINTYWRPTVQTCQPCTVGFVNPNPQQSVVCVAAPVQTDITPIVGGIAAAVGVIVVAAVLYFLYRKDKMMRENIRDTENAPKVAGQLLAIILTDIQSSTDLWSIAPLSMSHAIDTHNKVITEVIALNKGFFVKTSGDSFMIAVDCSKPSGAQKAAKIAADIQRNLMKVAFPRAINQIYNAQTDDELLDVEDEPALVDPPPEDPNALWHGLRVRIGIAIGTCEIKFDSLAKTYDYYGPLVNFSSRIEMSSHGGQILLSPESVIEINPASVDCTVLSCGKYQLRGTTEPVELHQLLPNNLQGRKTLFASFVPPDAKKVSDFDNGFVSPATNSTLGTTTLDDEESDDDSDIDATFASEDIIFMIALFRAVRPKEQESVLRVFENSWRVRPHKKTEDTLTAIAKKVSKVKITMAEQDERKALREFDRETQRTVSSTGSNSNGDGAIIKKGSKKKRVPFQALLENLSKNNATAEGNNSNSSLSNNNNTNNSDGSDQEMDSVRHRRVTLPPSPIAKKLGPQNFATANAHNAIRQAQHQQQLRNPTGPGQINQVASAGAQLKNNNNNNIHNINNNNNSSNNNSGTLSPPHQINSPSNKNNSNGNNNDAGDANVAKSRAAKYHTAVDVG